MAYKRAECLIFLPKQVVWKGSRSRGHWCTQKANSVKGYVLLASEFIEQHPKLVQLFDKNSLLVVRNRDVPRLPAIDEEMDFVHEIFLDDSPSASVDPLSISTDHEHTSLLPLLIRYTTVTFSREVWKASDMRPAVDDSNRKAFRRLVARSFRLRHSDTGGILHLATSRRQEVLMRMALENGAKINSKSEFGKTALHLAAIEGSVSLVKVLLEKGAEVNVYERNGFSPLLGARDLESIDILLDYGAQVDFSHFKKMYPIIGLKKLQLLLECGLIDPEPLANQLDLPLFDRYGQLRLRCIGDHVVKVMALHGLTDLRNFHVEEYWNGNLSQMTRFREECDAEVASMKRHKFSGTDVSMRDALARSDYHLYRLLKNPVVSRAIGPDAIKKRYPIYGGILNNHFRKGRHRRWLQREGVESLKLLSRGFHRLPDEIVEEIVGCLSTVDILKLRRASAGQP
ncbi:unnamed protein product [Bemisia tabaci]|uniref:Uncharacterized protein n=1 Tax=Bemisia tabaci TaxID=7038 RepID=A0A9P0AFA5_BEMTA|nr:unnamed protein product [Bemisia tabaci]